MSPALRLWDLVGLFVVSVVSLRWIASAAAGGPSSLTLWVLAVVCFFVPQGLAVADLSARFPDEGGLYGWTKRGYGDFHGFLCGWCYWVNNLLYFPSLLIYLCGSLAFALSAFTGDPTWETNSRFVVLVTLGTLWLVAGLSLIGVRYSKWVQDIGGLGNWIPAALVFFIGLWVALKYGMANKLTAETVWPSLHNWTRLGFFSQMCFALAGLELVSFLGSDVENPKKNLVGALGRASFFILFAYMAGTWGILATVPQEKITAVNGVILPLIELGAKIHWPLLAPVCAVLIAVAGLGTIMAWFSGAARVPYIVGLDSYLPAWLGRTHPRWKTPHLAILLQATLSTLFTLFATWGSPRLEFIYKVLVDMCLILYFIPYLYLFLTLIHTRLDRGVADEDSFQLTPRSRKVWGRIGLATTSFAIVMTLIPPDGYGWNLLLKTVAGTVAMIGIGLYFFLRQKVRKTAISKA